MTISIVNEIQETVFDKLALFVFDNPEINVDDVVNAAIVSYLKAQQEAQNA
jgi:hypothetical protein